MKRAPRLRNLSNDRKEGGRRGREARGALRQIDRIQGVLGDDEVGIARLGARRERGDEVGDRPSLLGRQGVGERGHRRAVEPRGHGPEDILSGRTSPEGPRLCEVRRAYRVAQVVNQGWRRRSVAAAEIAVALQAAVVLVELLPERNGLACGGRRARKLEGLRHTLGDREIGREGLRVVGEIRHFLVGQVGPGRHRRVGHAAPDDVDEVLMGRKRSARSRPNLELARREVAGPWQQVQGGIPITVPLLAVALHAVPGVERLARLPLSLGPDVRTLRFDSGDDGVAQRKRAEPTRRRAVQRANQESDGPAQNQPGGHGVWTSSLARGFCPVKS